MKKIKTYCWKCEDKVEMINKKENQKDNGSIILKGNCIDCNTLITKTSKQS